MQLMIKNQANTQTQLRT